MKRRFLLFLIFSIAAQTLLIEGDHPYILNAQEKSEKKEITKEVKTEKNDSDIKAVEKDKVEKTEPKKAQKKEEKNLKRFSLNLNDVEITEFINMMSQLIGKNIIVDDRVKGKITITSAKKVPVDQAMEIMKSILEVKGFALVESGNLIKVIPIQEAIKKNSDIIVDGSPLDSESDKAVTFILELKYSDSEEVANVLRPLKSKYTDIVVYRQMNVIIFSGTSTEIDGLVKIARSLDKKIEEIKQQGVTSAGNIHVIHLENADAVQLSEVLSRVPFSDSAMINTSPSHPIQPVQPGQPVQPNINQSSRARRITTQPSAQGGQKSKLSIVANKETNSLIIVAQPEEFKEIKTLIRELDIVREQVLIEALIMEVNAENGWGFGIDWLLGYKKGNNLIGGGNYEGSVPGYKSFTTPFGNKMVLPTSNGMNLGYISNTHILGFVLLNASGSDKNYNILSTPQILTVDNQEAELNVGEEIPVPTNNRISENGTQFFSFEYKPVGVKLKITPHITKKERITLDLYQEINSVIGETTITSSGTVIPPTLAKRDIKTKVSVFDGKTIVVGGLISNNKSVEESGVPVLSDIPLLGWLFKRKTVSYKKRNLLVFITPHIVTKKEKLDAITEQKKNSQKKLFKDQ